MLLNQLEDENQHPANVTFPPDNDTAQRVINEEQLSGYGVPCYFSHSDLSYNKTKHCQYLMDDCLYFRIKVDAKNTSKPWLV